MWKYRVETWKCLRDLRKPVRANEHTEYLEEKYFRTKKDAQKAFAKEIRDAKILMSQRRQQIGNCHEGILTKRYSDVYVVVGLHNRIGRVRPLFADQVAVRFRQIDQK